MKKVLFVTNDFGPRAGGIETFIIGLIERLPKNSVTVYTSRQDSTDEYDKKWREDYGVTVLRDRAKILLPTPRVSRNLSRVAKSLNPEIACFGAATPLGLLAPTLRRQGVSRIVSLTHGHEVWWAKVFPFNLAMKRVGSVLDSLSYLGEFTRQAIGKSLTSKSQKAMVRIAPGIDVDHFRPTESSIQLRRDLNCEDKAVIVSVGRLVHRKGQDRLIEALPKIRAKVPNVHLLLIGKGPYREHLQDLVKKNGVQDCVTFIGRLTYDELPAYIGVGDLFVMPSRSRFFGLEVEGLGIVYLEASACGVPVIAGKSGGAPDAVDEGITGIVVDGTDIDAIAASTSKLLLDKELARSMGEAGRTWVVANWSWTHWSKKFNEFLGI
ncbi:MAG: glycosyltransferase family 4 protein [Actinomycetota bacterium]